MNNLMEKNVDLKSKMSTQLDLTRAVLAKIKNQENNEMQYNTQEEYDIIEELDG
jgi:hypothetical protein